jgi:membrane fusion protein (multidrug efflux system)
LLEIETAPERLQLQEFKTRLAALDPQIRAIRDEIGAQETAQQEDRRSAEAALEQARAEYRDAAAQAQLAATEAERTGKLRDQKLVAEREFEAAQAGARSRRAAAEALQAAIVRQDRNLRRSQSDREADIHDLRSQLEQLEGQRLSTGRSIDRLSYEITRRRIVAPASGRLGEVSTLRPGSFVAQGDKLGVIIPSGQLRIIAEFPPGAAFGRIQPGQTARMRLQGFPWAQFGAVPAHVTNVGGEVRDGYVRVELAVDRHSSSIPLQHGLPGSVEVQVENVSPATLVLRSAGRLVGAVKSPYDRPNP